MADPTRRHHHTYLDYLALEESSNTKHEFVDGEIYAMAGGTPEHTALSVAVSSALYAQLRGSSCRVYSSDLRVRVLATGLTTYPDVSVLCGETETDPESPTTVTNPKVIVEVLSDSTADYDRGEKLAHYLKIPSLEAVVLVSHLERSLVCQRRDGQGDWHTESVSTGEALRFPSLGCELVVNEIYDGIVD